MFTIHVIEHMVYATFCHIFMKCISYIPADIIGFPTLSIRNSNCDESSFSSSRSAGIPPECLSSGSGETDEKAPIYPNLS